MIERFFLKLYHISGLNELSLSHFIFYISTILSAFLIELFLVGWTRSSLKRITKFSGTTKTDLICWLLDFFNLYNFIGILMSFGLCYYLAGQVQKNFHFNLISRIDNHYLQYFIILVASDLNNYIRHRIFHVVTPLWKLHEFHHSATEFNILTTHRGHFLEISLSSFFSLIPFVILGVSLESFIVVITLKEIHQLLLHSSLESDWGLIGRYVFVSPAAHRIHHSIESKHYQKNLGGLFIFWDRIFGTYFPYEKIDQIGIPDNIYNQKGFVYDVLTGAKKFIFFSKNKDS